MRTPQIIRTRKQLAKLDPETVLLRTGGLIVNTLHANQISPIYDLPAAVIASGKQVRAARKLLEQETT